MATVKEMPEQAGTFTISLDGRSVRRVWDIYADVNDARPDQVVGLVEALGVVWGSAHPTYTTAKLSEFEAKQHDDRHDHWTVTAIYTTHLVDPSSGNDTDTDPSQPAMEFRDPLAEPAKIAWSSQLREIALMEDVNGDPILNYAKRPYDPPPTDWTIVTVFRKEVNKANFLPSDISKYVNRVNSTTFQGFSPRQCLCVSLVATKRWRQWRVDDSSPLQTTPYWAVATEIHCIDDDDKPTGMPGGFGSWDLYLLQQDIMEIKGGELVEIVDGNGMPVREPQPIDDLGAFVPLANRPVDITYRAHLIKRTAELNNI